MSVANAQQGELGNSAGDVAPSPVTTGDGPSVHNEQNGDCVFPTSPEQIPPLASESQPIPDLPGTSAVSVSTDQIQTQISSDSHGSRDNEPTKVTHPRIAPLAREENFDSRASSLQTLESRDRLDDVIHDSDLEGEVILVPPPVSGPLVAFCPPGLDDLLDVGQLVYHTDNFRRKEAVVNPDRLSRLEVIDIAKRVIFIIEEEPPPYSNKSFCFKIYNKDLQEVASIHNPTSRLCVCLGASWHCLRALKFEAVVFSPPGQLAGYIRRSRTWILQEYEVLLTLRGGAQDMELFTPDLEDELGRLAVRGWHGIMHEARRAATDYGLTFPLDLDVRVKAILMAAVPAIDWVYRTKGSYS